MPHNTQTGYTKMMKPSGLCFKGRHSFLQCQLCVSVLFFCVEGSGCSQKSCSCGIEVSGWDMQTFCDFSLANAHETSRKGVGGKHVRVSGPSPRVERQPEQRASPELGSRCWTATPFPMQLVQTQPHTLQGDHMRTFSCCLECLQLPHFLELCLQQAAKLLVGNIYPFELCFARVVSEKPALQGE